MEYLRGQITLCAINPEIITLLSVIISINVYLLDISFLPLISFIYFIYFRQTNFHFVCTGLELVVQDHHQDNFKHEPLSHLSVFLRKKLVLNS